MEWIYLLVAGILEIAWAVAMKMSNGFTEPLPSIVTGIGYLTSAIFLAIALKQLPLGTAYAIWTGMGIIGTTLIGVLLFHDKFSGLQIVCVVLILIGIGGLKLLGKS